MAVMAKWKDKKWEVSSKRIAALNGVAASVKLDTEHSDDKAGSPSAKNKALELQSMTFDFDLAYAAGCDVRKEYESWVGMIGEVAPFYLAGKRFGPEKMQLTGVSLSETLLNDFGQILKGRITVNLTEYAPEASSKKSVSKSKSSSGSKTPGITQSGQSAIGSRLSAAGITASSEDKAAKKPANNALSRADRSLPIG